MVTRQRGPSYDFDELIAGCSVPGQVNVRKDAREDAKTFGFDTQERILQFLSIRGFEDLQFQNSSTLDHPPDAGTFFDAYFLRIGPKFVYFAFYKRPNGKWIIKSFHPPEHGEFAPSLSHTPFAMLEELKL